MKDAKDKDGHSVKILGRAGMIYEDKGTKYFVDSEMLVGPEYDIVIYTGSIRPNKEENGVILSQTKKDEIISIIAKLLKSENIRADFQP